MHPYTMNNLYIMYRNMTVMVLICLCVYRQRIQVRVYKQGFTIGKEQKSKYIDHYVDSEWQRPVVRLIRYLLTSVRYPQLLDQAMMVDEIRQRNPAHKWIWRGFF